MAFIEKENPIILNIKLTSKGRELLAKGDLTFNSFALGDSEIDYDFINKFEMDGSNLSILRPKDKNPNIISFIKKKVSDTNNLYELNSIPVNSWMVNNSVNDYGFFDVSDENNIKIHNDLIHTKQSDCNILIRDVRGDDELRIRKSSTYGNNSNEPEIGDFIMVRWTNPNYNNTDNFDINTTDLHPILFYRIEDIVAGTLFDDNLIVKVDRNLPDFSGYFGENKSGVIIYRPEINVDLGTTYSTDFIEDAVFSFIENYNLPTKEIPFWNMSIVFTNNVAGVLETNKLLSQYNSSKYAGFVNYIQNYSKKYDNLGIIHYTNASPANTYGEGFYYNTPKLFLPTIMWHKDNGKMGLTLSCGEEYKTLENLNIKYYDLIDDNGNIVGKVFNGLKIFIVEDPELLMAMSFKSNRNWTLPNYELAINSKVSIGECVECTLDFTYTTTHPESIGDTGSIELSNITMSDIGGNVLIVLKNNDNNNMQTLQYSGETNVTINNLIVGNYTITLYDLSAPDCFVSEDFSIDEIDSTLNIYDVEIYKV
jgi:hypothetical protein